jgi:hypothetical protein
LFFRPPPSEALEIFERPPSPSMATAIRTIRAESGQGSTSVASMSTLPYAVPPGQPAVGASTLEHTNGTAVKKEPIQSGSSAAVPPQTPRTTRYSSSSAMAASQYASTSANGALPVTTAGSLTGSPFAVRKTVKLGSKKGKGKATESEHVVSLSVQSLLCIPPGSITCPLRCGRCCSGNGVTKSNEERLRYTEATNLRLTGFVVLE